MIYRLIILSLLTGGLVQAQIDGDPLYENRVHADRSTFYAWRPLYSASTSEERWRKDVLWPLYTRKGFQDETYSRFLFFGYTSDFSSQDDRHRIWVIPFYFKGTAATGDDYFALFPLGGTIREIFGRDKVSFVLFPVYATSNIDEVHTTTVLWPIGSKTTSDRIARFRIWPFYGYSTLEDEFHKKFVLWPFYTSVQYTNDRNPGGGFILVPVYGRIITEGASNYWLVAPLFRYMHSDQQWIVHAPWPFIQMADGQMYKRIVWPLYGKKQLGTLTRQFFVWPLFWNNTTQYARHEQRRVYVLPLFSHQWNTVTQSNETEEVGEVFSRYWKIWPLMSWDRNEDSSRFRMLELWPLRNTPGIERNWAPWWTLYRRVEAQGEVGHHLLWGVYRQQREEERFEWSLLKGIAGYKKEQNSRRYRFLFLWFGGGEEHP